jgi:hypothetical protein
LGISDTGHQGNVPVRKVYLALDDVVVKLCPGFQLDDHHPLLLDTVWYASREAGGTSCRFRGELCCGSGVGFSSWSAVEAWHSCEGEAEVIDIGPALLDEYLDIIGIYDSGTVRMDV